MQGQGQASRRVSTRQAGACATKTGEWSLLNFKMMRKLLAVALLSSSLLLAEDIPRPEYPQPQFQREQWMNLNGPWELGN
jgi:hypothetical protein